MSTIKNRLQRLEKKAQETQTERVIAKVKSALERGDISIEELKKDWPDVTSVYFSDYLRDQS